MAKSSIEWTELTWNPTTGCSKISAGCKNCYAESMSKRLKAMGLPKYKNGFNITLHPDELYVPFGWKKSRMVFVNSMSDLFHEDVPLHFIKKVFEVMNRTPQHIYQILTKRSNRIVEINEHLNWSKNIWLGVSVEDYRVVNRIDDLRKSNAEVKFLSCEPLIGSLGKFELDNIDWVIVGGESGHNAREINHQWIEEIKNLCEHNNIPFFFKQWGKARFNTDNSDPTIHKSHPDHAKGGCLLNGRIYKNFPVTAVC